MFNPWVGKIPWKRKWQPTLVFLPGEFQGQRSLEGYGPFGHKELDTNEWAMLSSMFRERCRLRKYQRLPQLYLSLIKVWSGTHFDNNNKESVTVTLWLRKNLISMCCVKSLQSHLTLCDSMDCSSPGSSVHGILQARVLEWFEMPFSRGSSQPTDGTHISYISCVGGQVLYH